MKSRKYLKFLKEKNRKMELFKRARLGIVSVRAMFTVVFAAIPAFLVVIFCVDNETLLADVIIIRSQFRT